jgi:hypothetical protein
MIPKKFWKKFLSGKSKRSPNPSGQQPSSEPISRSNTIDDPLRHVVRATIFVYCMLCCTVELMYSTFYIERFWVKAGRLSDSKEEP